MEDSANHPEINGGDSTEIKADINPHLQEIKEDALYHIGLNSGKQDLKKMFRDVKVGVYVTYSHL